jgi:PAS domain-containing protein
MAALDPEGRVVVANAALVRAVGDAPAGTEFASLLRPEDRPGWREAWARLGTGARVSVTARGAGREVVFAWTLQQSAADQAVFVVGQPAEVQQRGAIHLEVLRSVVANLPLVLFAVDTRGEVVLLEGQGLAAIGLTPLEVQSGGRARRSRCSAGSPRCATGSAGRSPGRRCAGCSSSSTATSRRGRRRCSDEQGRMHGAIGLASDVTENGHVGATPARPQREAGDGARRGDRGQQGQERLPGQHEPRAAHAAQRDHRLQRDRDRRAARAGRADRRGELASSCAPTSARSTSAGRTCWGSSATSSTCRRSRRGGWSCTSRRSRCSR